MEIISKIKGFFKKKEITQEAKELNILTPDTPQIQEAKQQDIKRYVEQKCELCQGVIGEERWSKIQGKFFHKTCFKKKKQEVMSGKGVQW